MVLICFSLTMSDVRHLFMYLLTICMSSLKKMPIQVLCPFLNWVTWFFTIELCEFLIYVGYYLIIKCVVCKCFLPFSDAIKTLFLVTVLFPSLIFGLVPITVWQSYISGIFNCLWYKLHDISFKRTFIHAFIEPPGPPWLPCRYKFQGLVLIHTHHVRKFSRWVPGQRRASLSRADCYNASLSPSRFPRWAFQAWPAPLQNMSGPRRCSELIWSADRRPVRGGFCCLCKIRDGKEWHRAKEKETVNEQKTLKSEKWSIADTHMCTRTHV